MEASTPTHLTNKSCRADTVYMPLYPKRAMLCEDVTPVLQDTLRSSLNELMMSQGDTLELVKTHRNSELPQSAQATTICRNCYQCCAETVTQVEELCATQTALMSSYAERLRDARSAGSGRRPEQLPPQQQTLVEKDPNKDTVIPTQPDTEWKIEPSLSMSFAEPAPLWRGSKLKKEAATKKRDVLKVEPAVILFNHYEVGMTYENVSTWPVRYALRPPATRSAMRVLAGARRVLAAGERRVLRVLFAPRSRRSLAQELVVRADCGGEQVVLLRACLTPPRLRGILLDSLSKEISDGVDDHGDCMARHEVLDFGTVLIGSVSDLTVLLYNEGGSDTFFIMSEDSWFNCDVSNVTRSGALCAAPFSVRPVYARLERRAGLLARARFAPGTRGLHAERLRVLTRSGRVRAMHLLGDAVRFRAADVRIEAQEKAVDIDSDERSRTTSMLDMGELSPGDDALRYFHVFNDSPVCHRYEWRWRRAGLELAPARGRLAAGRRLRVAARVQPAGCCCDPLIAVAQLWLCDIPLASQIGDELEPGRSEVLEVGDVETEVLVDELEIRWRVVQPRVMVEPRVVDLRSNPANEMEWACVIVQSAVGGGELRCAWSQEDAAPRTFTLRPGDAQRCCLPLPLPQSRVCCTNLLAATSRLYTLNVNEGKNSTNVLVVARSAPPRMLMSAEEVNFGIVKAGTATGGTIVLSNKSAACMPWMLKMYPLNAESAEYLHVSLREGSGCLEPANGHNVACELRAPSKTCRAGALLALRTAGIVPQCALVRMRACAPHLVLRPAAHACGTALRVHAEHELSLHLDNPGPVNASYSWGLLVAQDGGCEEAQRLLTVVASPPMKTVEPYSSVTITIRILPKFEFDWKCFWLALDGECPQFFTLYCCAVAASAVVTMYADTGNGSDETIEIPWYSTDPVGKETGSTGTSRVETVTRREREAGGGDKDAASGGTWSSSNMEEGTHCISSESVESSPVFPVVQFTNLPLNTVRSRVLSIGVESPRSLRWSAELVKFERRPSQRADYTCPYDEWSSSCRVGGFAALCEPAGGELGAESCLLTVSVRADTWGLYRDHLLLQMDGFTPLVIPVWVEAVGVPLYFPVAPAASTSELHGPHLRFDSIPINDPETRALVVRNTSCAAVVVRLSIRLEEERDFAEPWAVESRVALTDAKPPAELGDCEERSSHFERRQHSDQMQVIIPVESLMEESAAASGAAGPWDAVRRRSRASADRGPPDDEIVLSVEPEKLTLEPRGEAHVQVTLCPSARRRRLSADIVVSAVAVSICGDGWYRPAPRDMVVRVHVLREPITLGLRLTTSPQELIFRVSATTAITTPANMLRIRKRLTVSGSCGGPVVVRAAVARPFFLRRGRELCAATELRLAPADYQKLTVECRVDEHLLVPPARLPGARALADRLLFTCQQVFLQSVPVVLQVDFPVIRTQPDCFNFGDCYLGATETGFVVVSHSSNIDNISFETIIKNSEEFKVWPEKGNIKVGESVMLQVSFTPLRSAVPSEGAVAVSAAGAVWCRSAVRLRGHGTCDQRFLR